MDEALSRNFQEIVDIINEFNAPSKDVEDNDEMPDDADDDANAGDMALDNVLDPTLDNE